MTEEIPQYCLRAYALFFSKYSSKESFSQSTLDWMVSQSMKKKIFSILLNSGWIKKVTRTLYRCVNPEIVMKGLLEFKVPMIIALAKKKYAFTELSAVEIWSDYSYVQRSLERSPYFIKILKKDISYWKEFFSRHHIPYYFNQGSTIGEYVILIPVAKIEYTDKEGIHVEPVKAIAVFAKNNELYTYAYKYMRKKYGSIL